MAFVRVIENSDNFTFCKLGMMVFRKKPYGPPFARIAYSIFDILGVVPKILQLHTMFCGIVNKL